MTDLQFKIAPNTINTSECVSHTNNTGVFISMNCTPYKMHSVPKFFSLIILVTSFSYEYCWSLLSQDSFGVPVGRSGVEWRGGVGGWTLGAQSVFLSNVSILISDWQALPLATLPHTAGNVCDGEGYGGHGGDSNWDDHGDVSQGCQLLQGPLMREIRRGVGQCQCANGADKELDFSD